MYAIIKVINGHFFVDSEGFTTTASAKVNYHELCRNLWNAPDVSAAQVMIVDENLNVVEGYREYIKKGV